MDPCKDVGGSMGLCKAVGASVDPHNGDRSRWQCLGIMDPHKHVRPSR